MRGGIGGSEEIALHLMIEAGLLVNVVEDEMGRQKKPPHAAAAAITATVEGNSVLDDWEIGD